MLFSDHIFASIESTSSQPLDSSRFAFLSSFTLYNNLAKLDNPNPAVPPVTIAIFLSSGSGDSSLSSIEDLYFRISNVILVYDYFFLVSMLALIASRRSLVGPFSFRAVDTKVFPFIFASISFFSSCA